MKRITTKTKKLLKELSKRYSTVTNRSPTEFNEASQPSTFRSQLKRRLSSVSIRRHNSGPKWKWTKRFTENNQFDSNFQPASYLDGVPQSQSHKQVNNLSELFQSTDFATRLSLGSVSGRKSYPEGEETTGDYHISYRETNDDENQNPEASSGEYQFLKLQETLSYLKDQTIKRTKSLHSLAKLFGQEVN